MDAVRAGRRAALAIGLLLALCAGRAHAIVGHYTAGLPNVHDYFIPPAGLYYAQYFYFYTTDTFKDRNGDSIDSVTIRRGPAAGTVLDLDLNLNQYVIAPTIMVLPTPDPALGQGVRVASDPGSALEGPRGRHTAIRKLRPLLSSDARRDRRGQG